MKNLFNIYTPIKDVKLPEVSKLPEFNTYEYVKDVEPIVEEYIIDEIEDDDLSNLNFIKTESPVIKKPEAKKVIRKTYTNYKGLQQFNKFYDEVEKEMPEAKHYRALLTDLADKESSFRSSIQNSAGAPAYGYFQFMQDGVKYNNITHYAGVDIDTFRNDPKLQIKAAVKLAKEFKNTFNAKDREIAKSKGITEKGLLSGAWLAGVGGVRAYLYNNNDKSDGFTTVSQRIKELNT